MLSFVNRNFVNKLRRLSKAPLWLALLMIAFWLVQSVPLLKKAEGQVLAVHDGDTLTIHVENKDQRVRLYGIDAPELSQRHGNSARVHLTKLTQGKIVKVEKITEDRYNRWVVKIWADNQPQSINALMVSEGWAWWYRHYAENWDEVQQLEKNARREKRGLWRDRSPKPPWEYRSKD